MNQRGQTRSPRSGKRPLPHRHAEQRGAGGEASAGPGLHTQAGWRAGPLGARPGPRDPPPPRLGREPGNGHPPPLAARARGPGFRPDTSRARSRCPAPRGFQDPGQRPRGWRERRRGSAPPAPRGGRCGRGAYPAVRRSVLRTLRSGSRGRRPSGLGCLRPGWRADPRARRRVPRARSSLPPRAPPRACALADSGLGTGRGGAGGAAGGASEGGAPFTSAAPGLLGSPWYRTEFPFHRRGD